MQSKRTLTVVVAIIIGMALPLWSQEMHTAPFGDPQAPPTYPLARIEAIGLHRFTLADVTRLSGLKVGQPVGPREIDAAVAQMVSAGVFKAVRYRVSNEAGQLALTFEIDEETDWSLPVVYDNFIWMTDDELNAAVREAVPAYDGTAPVSSQVPEIIARALTSVLRRHNISADVEHNSAGKLDGSDRRHVFSVSKPAPLTCALHIDGATKIKEADLLRIVPGIVGRPYSRSYLAELSKKGLTQAYLGRGYWRAVFQSPAVTPGTAGSCTGALVTIHVDEGIAYRFGPNEWTGNAAIAKSTLDRLLGVPSDVLKEPLNMRIRLAAIRAAYQHVGYLEQTATLEPVFDDAAGRMHVRGAIVEGPQFHMGTVSVEGLTPADGDLIKRGWKLKTGDVFDVEYVTTFRQQYRALVVQTTTHADTKRVDVTVKPK